MDNGQRKEIKKPSQGYDFGTFKGVFTPSILTILGVVMYLRLGWVLGNLGLAETLLVVTIATAITFLTALSISQLATNMKVGGGGAYYIISRSLGLEAGAAIGIPLFFAQALGISFYLAGFSESVVNVFPGLSPIHVSLITLTILTLLAYISADLALKMQFLILAMIVASLISFFMGGVSSSVEGVAVTATSIPRGNFWMVFAVFFPAVTGIEAGLAMSGDLKNTERSLPRGTLAAIGLSYAVYLAIPIFLHGIGVEQRALLSNFMIMKDVARWGDVVMCGLWGAALSSALGALLGAPRTLQALAQDQVLPRWVGQGYGKKKDPRMATAIAFIVALVGVLLGDINVIAPILSMFFLTSYGLLNFSAAFEGIIGNPSWRPKFEVHWLFPLCGAVGCVMVMFLINPGATFMALFVSAFVFYLMEKRKLNAYWGDMRYGLIMLIIRTATYALMRIKTNEKTWRPNILVLSGSPQARWYLIALADAISHGKGFLTVAAIVSKQMEETERIENMQESMRNYLKERDVPAIVKVINAEDVFEGAKGLIENYGFGPLLPNTVLLGQAQGMHNLLSYASLILLIAQRQRNLIIVREEEKKDHPVLAESLRIDLWWRRIGDNSGLMLALAHLLKTSPEWMGSRLVIKTVAVSEEDKAMLSQQLGDFVRKENMQAEIEILLHDSRDVYKMIVESSREASLVFVGMRAPNEKDTPQSYAKYYQELLENLEGLPTTVMVLASERIDFDRIFALRQ